MSALQFIASVVRSIAWPAILLVVVIVLRRPISTALSGGLRRLKVGPFEAEWREEASTTVVQVARAVASAEQRQTEAHDPADPMDALRQLAVTSPRAAVLQAFGLIEQELHEMTRVVDPAADHRFGAHGVATLAHRHGLITEASVRAVEGLTVMRNLAVHDDETTGRLDTDKALEFIDLVAATLFAIRFERRKAVKS